MQPSPHFPYRSPQIFQFTFIYTTMQCLIHTTPCPPACNSLGHLITEPRLRIDQGCREPRVLAVLRFCKEMGCMLGKVLEIITHKRFPPLRCIFHPSFFNSVPITEGRWIALSPLVALALSPSLRPQTPALSVHIHKVPSKRKHPTKTCTITNQHVSEGSGSTQALTTTPLENTARLIP